MDWTGSVERGDAGQTSASWQTAILDRVNEARSRAGLAAVSLDPERTEAAQQAAFLMYANQKLSHRPSPAWVHWSSVRAAGAARCNLSLGSADDTAVDAMMREAGLSNLNCNHRNWLLLPQLRRIGVGGATGRGMSSVAIFVRGANEDGERPVVRDGFIAWPPPGVMPLSQVPEKWTLSVPDADFRASTITATREGRPLVVKEVTSTVSLYRERIIVFSLREQGSEEPIFADATEQGPDASLSPVIITVDGLRVGEAARKVSYEVGFARSRRD
jgi:hypothetical protein